MAAYTQTQNSVSSSYYNFFLSKVPEGEDYIIFAVDGYYICIYGNYTSDNTFEDSTVIRISRSSGSQGIVSYHEEDTTTFTINYEYYSYSNIGTGTYLADPRATEYTKNFSMIHTSLLFALVLLFVGFNVIKKRWIR